MRLLREVKDKGGARACLRYLEYLTIECKVEDPTIHTELACLYVEYVKSSLQQYEGEGGKIECAKADNDRFIFGKSEDD